MSIAVSFRIHARENIRTATCRRYGDRKSSQVHYFSLEFWCFHLSLSLPVFFFLFYFVRINGRSGKLLIGILVKMVPVQVSFPFFFVSWLRSFENQLMNFRRILCNFFVSGLSRIIRER